VASHVSSGNTGWTIFGLKEKLPPDELAVRCQSWLVQIRLFHSLSRAIAAGSPSGSFPSNP
jgi:hypothetical protein